MESASAVHARLARIRETPQPGDLLLLLLLHECAAKYPTQCPGIPGPDEMIVRMRELMSRQGWDPYWRGEIHPDAKEVHSRTGISVASERGEAKDALARIMLKWAHGAFCPSHDERNDASFFQAPAFIVDPLTRNVVGFLLRANSHASRMCIFRCVMAAGQGILPETTAPTRPV